MFSVPLRPACRRRVPQALLPLILAFLITLGGLPAPAMAPVLARAAADTVLTPADTLPGLAAGRTEINLPVLSYIEESEDGPGYALDVYRIVVEHNPAPRLRVGFLERVAGGVGEELRYSAWLSAIVASQLTGVLLDELTVTFDFYDHVDGPSAGGIMTSAVAAALLGHELDSDVVMTGTIHPDGTIGPVGGIAEKILAASESGHSMVLIPLGQRFEETDDGDTIDLYALGESLGVEVREVGDIYTAYALITGQPLPRFQPAPDMPTDVPQWLADALRSLYETTAIWVEDLLEVIAELGHEPDPSVVEYMTAAEDAARAGRVAQAYTQMNLAARFASLQALLLDAQVEPAAARGDLDTLAEAVDIIAEEVRESVAILEEMSDELQGSLSPEDLAQVPFLLDLHGLAMTAIEALNMAETALGEAADLLEAHAGARLNRIERRELAAEIRERLERAADWQRLADDLLTQAYDRQLLMKAVPASGLKPDPELATRLADVQRSAAWAALNYFKQLVMDLEELPMSAVEAEFLDNDANFALALPVIQGLPQPEEELLDPYVALGGGLRAYHLLGRAIHMHYTLGQTASEDDADELNAELLDHVLNVGEDGAGVAIARAQAAGLDPSLSLMHLEAAQGLRKGDTASRLQAMLHYWQAEALARILTELAP